MKNVFVSYTRRNLTVIERLARDLQDAGLEVWVDFRKIRGGEAWQQAIYDGIRDCDFVVVCLSPPAVESEWVRRELEIAKDMGKLIIPVMLEVAFDEMRQYEITNSLLDVQAVNFAELSYERAFPTLLGSLPGISREARDYDDIDPSEIPNPFKGLEAFQETDYDIFFGREQLIERALVRMKTCLEEDDVARFMAFVGASGSGKSSLVRAGVIPSIRRGKVEGSENFPIVIFKPGNRPTGALALRLQPLMGEVSIHDLINRLEESPESLVQIADEILEGSPPDTHLVLLIDQFEETFTRTSHEEQMRFFDYLHHAVTAPEGRVLVIITMRADFFDRLSHFPKVAGLFEHNNLQIVAEMSPEELRRSIEGPAYSVGLVYDHGLPDRILDEVLQQPGSLPLLQYCLTHLFEERDRRRLTWDSYNTIGGVQQALAQHAENVYRTLNSAQQDIMQRLLLRLVEVSESGEATRRRVKRSELDFERVSENALNDILDMMTSALVRLLVTSRELRADEDPEETEPTIWVEVVHEALITQWDRFQNWVHEDEENLRLSTELNKTAQDWANSNHDEAYLLTQTRLDRALLWLQTADASELQRELINASVEARRIRQEAEQEQQQYVYSLEERSRRRLQMFVVVLAVGVVLSIGLAIFGFFQANNAQVANAQAQTQAAIAQDAKAEAENQEQLVRSRALAQSVFEVLAEPNTPLALALAIEANSFENPPPLAQNALASASFLGPREVYDGREAIGTDGQVLALAYNASNEAIALGAKEGSIIAWELDTDKQLWELEWPTEATVQTIEVSPNGRFAAAGDSDGTVIVWQMVDRKELRRLDLQANGGIFDIAFQPNGSLIATASENGLIQLHNVASETYKFDLQGHEGSVLSIAFSPNGERILSGGKDNTVRLWSITSDTELMRMDGHISWVRSVAFNPDVLRNRAISGSSDGSIFVWDLSTGTLEKKLEHVHNGSITRLGYHPNGVSFVSASADGEIILWDSRLLTERHRYQDYRNEVTEIIYNPDGNCLLSVGDEARIILWDVEPATVVRRFEEHDNWVLDAAFSPDGQSALSVSLDGQMILWNVETGESDTKFVNNTGLASVDYSSNGVTAMIGLVNGDVMLWDASTWEWLGTFSEHTDTVRDIEYSPDGRTALSSSDDGTMILWDVEQKTLVRRFETAEALQIWSVAFSPDGRYILSGDEGGNVMLWDTNTGELISSLVGLEDEKPHSDTVRSVAFSTDGQWAMSAADDNTILLWTVDGDNIEALRLLEGHTNRVLSVDFSPDSQFALSASDDRTIIMWDFMNGQVLRQFTGHVDWVNKVSYSPDGRSAISASADNSLILWRIDTQRELLNWTLVNREIAEFDCVQRGLYQLDVTCDGGDETLLTVTPYITEEAVVTIIPSQTALPSGLTETPTLEPSPMATEAATSVPATASEEKIAESGDNRGEIAENTYEQWLYDAQAGDVLSIHVNADIPAQSSETIGRVANGLDTVVYVYLPGGKLLASNDDIEDGLITDSRINSLELPESGTYRIEVHAYNNESAGEYTLNIE